MDKLNFLEHKKFETPDDVSVGVNEDKDAGVSITREGNSFRTFIMSQSMILTKNKFNKGVDFLNLQIPAQYLSRQTDLEWIADQYGILNQYMKEFVTVKDDIVKKIRILSCGIVG